MSVAVGSFISRADAALTKLDKATLSRLNNIFEAEYNRLEAELRKLYNAAEGEIKASSKEFREARARILLEQLEGLLQLMSDPKYAAAMSDHLEKVVRSELEQSSKLLSEFGAVNTARVPIETIAALSGNVQARLAHHGQVFALQAEEAVVQGLIHGHGFGKMASRLRERAGIARWRAEMIVRTETMQASDVARRASYQENGVKHVMRIATQDSRVCGHCLARAGNVYLLEEAPQSLHPNDRCYNAPFKPEWLEAGLISQPWVLQHAEAAAERSKDKPRRGAAPFEAAAGLRPPRPIWTPRGGYS